MKYRCSCHPHCAFHWRDPDYPQVLTWGELAKQQVASERSTEVVNAKRKTGVDIAHIPGLSAKVDARALDPKRFHVFMKAITGNGKNQRAK